MLLLIGGFGGGRNRRQVHGECGRRDGFLGTGTMRDGAGLFEHPVDLIDLIRFWWYFVDVHDFVSMSWFLVMLFECMHVFIVPIDVGLYVK